MASTRHKFLGRSNSDEDIASGRTNQVIIDLDDTSDESDSSSEEDDLLQVASLPLKKNLAQSSVKQEVVKVVLEDQIDSTDLPVSTEECRWGSTYNDDLLLTSSSQSRIKDKAALSKAGEKESISPQRKASEVKSSKWAHDKFDALESQARSPSKRTTPKSAKKKSDSGKRPDINQSPASKSRELFAEKPTARSPINNNTNDFGMFRQKSNKPQMTDNTVGISTQTHPINFNTKDLAMLRQKSIKSQNSDNAVGLSAQMQSVSITNYDSVGSSPRTLRQVSSNSLLLQESESSKARPSISQKAKDQLIASMDRKMRSAPAVTNQIKIPGVKQNNIVDAPEFVPSQAYSYVNSPAQIYAPQQEVDRHLPVMASGQKSGPPITMQPMHGANGQVYYIGENGMILSDYFGYSPISTHLYPSSPMDYEIQGPEFSYGQNPYGYNTSNISDADITAPVIPIQPPARTTAHTNRRSKIKNGRVSSGGQSGDQHYKKKSQNNRS